jgi:hypothetical protein
MWARKHPCCTKCSTTTYKHYGSGLCKRCYQTNWSSTNSTRIREYKHEWYEASKARIDYNEKNLKQRNGEYAATLVKDSCCARCGTKENLHIHHVDHKGHNVPSNQRNNAPGNIEILCRECHGAVHGNICGWSRKYACCRGCDSTNRKHQAKGYCTRCYYHFVDKLKV